MSLVYILGSRLVLANSGNFEKSLGSRAAYLKEYYAIQIGDKVVGYPTFYDLDDLDIHSVLNKSPEEIIQETYYKLLEVPYVVDQSDPGKLSSGGNCQALSLYFGEVLHKQKIIFSYELSKGLDHMSLVAKVGDDEIEIDVVNKILKYRGR